jgi:ketosteroid isomerase-like protein
MKKLRLKTRKRIWPGLRWVGLFMVVGSFSCATVDKSGIANHRATSAEERRIVKLMLDLQYAMNSADTEKILSLYTPDAGIMMDLAGERIGVLLTKDEYAPQLAKKVNKPSFRKCKYRFDFLEPTEFFLDGEDALMTLPVEVRGTGCYYREKAVFFFEFRKAASGWKICKSTWEVLESTNPKYKGAK